MVRDRHTAVAKFATHVAHEALTPWDKPPLDSDRRHGPRAFLALRDFENHMTDESWQIQLGLQAARYRLFGKGFADQETDASKILAEHQPKTVIVADRREWDPSCSGCFDKQAGFQGMPSLRAASDVFRVTIVKDMWFNHEWTYEAHRSIDPHLYLHYYRTELVRQFRPWIRSEQMFRIWHPIDRRAVPEVDYAVKRDTPLLSGALSNKVYPLRTRIATAAMRNEFNAVVLNHPGYNNHGPQSTEYLATLARHKIAICTSSIFGCTLRKMIEATAVGCVVITDLPADEHYPAIDANLVRVRSDIDLDDLAATIRREASVYDEESQRARAARAIRAYDYRALGEWITQGIEHKRQEYKA